jgi:hypothetical protein
VNDVIMCNTFAVTSGVALGRSNMIVDDNLTFIIWPRM